MSFADAPSEPGYRPGTGPGYGRGWVKGGFARAAVALGLLAGLSAQTAFACGKSASIDGSDREWDRGGDFVKHMRKDGSASGTELTDLHLRCDPATGKAHAMVMAKPGYTLSDSTDASIKVDGVVVANKHSRDFSWIYKDGQRVGYECSFKYDFSREHTVRAKAKVKHSYRWHTSYHDADSGDHQHHFQCQTTPTPPPTPGALSAVCGIAAIDGTVESDWNTASAPKTELKSSGGTATADLYVRHQGGTAYVLVLAKTGYTLYNYADYNKVTVGTTVVTPSSQNFKWVYNSSGYRIGYEVSIPATPGQSLIAQAKATKSGKYYISTNVDRTLQADCGSSVGDCGTAAVVDGDRGEWDLTKDFYAPMWEAGDPTKPNPVLLSNLYFRWKDGIAYILVLAEDQYTVDRSDAWVKFYDNGQQTVNFKDFAWVKNTAGKTIGYEASFAMTANVLSAEVHVQISGSGSSGSCGGRTSSTGKKFKGTISLDIPVCTTPTYGLGNRVWQEVNGLPGYQPADGDLPVGAVRVDVLGYDDNGQLITESDGVTPKVFGSAATDNSATAKKGCYLVGNLPAGNYAARILAANIPAGLKGIAIEGTQSAVFAGSDEGTDDTGAADTDASDQNGLQNPNSNDIRTSNLFSLQDGVVPTGEASDASCGLGGLADAAVNSTADFALEAANPLVGIGDRIYVEVNGVEGYQPDEGDTPVPAGTPVEVVKVASVAGETDTVVGSDTTDNEGCYLVEGLNTGLYYARLPSSLFATGGVLRGYSPASPYTDEGTTADDGTDHNGRPELDGTTATGGVVTGTYTLSPGMAPLSNVISTGTEVSGERACQSKQGSLPDGNVDRTADIALVQQFVAIGNKVWIEDSNDKTQVPGRFDGSDKPVANILVTLDRIDPITGEVLPDSSTSVTTDDDGFYLFDDQIPGTFRITIPAEVFQSGAVLDQALPSSGQETVARATDDNTDHNGQPSAAGPAVDGVSSLVFSVWPGSAPTLEPGQNTSTGTAGSGDSALPDASVDLTRDFAFSRAGGDKPPVGMSLGSTVWIDGNANGLQDGDEPGIEGVTVVLTGGDLAEPRTITTGTNGNYLFSGLNAGSYTVTIPATEMVDSGKVATALKEYWGARNLPSAVPAKAVSTVVAVVSPTVDGDNNGEQSGGMGTEAVAGGIALVSYGQPADGAGVYDEHPTGTDTTGYQQDQNLGDGTAGNNEDQNGDMTIDFGFVHQCPVACDIDGDGRITKQNVTFAQSACITTTDSQNVKHVDTQAMIDAGYSDTYIIRCRFVYDPQWAVTNGGAGSGDCDGNGNISGNDATWCGRIAETIPAVTAP